MHISKFLITALACALFVAPAAAAVTVHDDPGGLRAIHALADPVELLAVATPAGDAFGLVCQATIEVDVQLLFVDAADACNPALVAATGRCLAPVPAATTIVSVALAPDRLMSCPAPPG